jgi:hypothetical protein
MPPISPPPPFERSRVRVRVGVRVAVQDHVGAARAHRVDLDVRRRHRHDDHRATAERLCRERHALRVIARRGRDHAAPQLGRRQARHPVVGAADLEGEHRLRILALEQDPVADPRGQVRGEVEWRLVRHVVHPRPKNPLEVVDRHAEPP